MIVEIHENLDLAGEPLPSLPSKAFAPVPL